ncbi:MAG: ATP-binding protein [Snowella sp.]|nr:ATP-binding protein [Snowella sp.]
MSEELMTEIYNVFDPFDPPPKEAYVNCEEARGRWDVLRELGRKITRSKGATCQLYTGHRGVGKSTELLRLREWLISQNYFVVYFAANDEDIDPGDTKYVDILLACTKHLVQAIKLADENPLKGLTDWLEKRSESLKDLLLTPLTLDGLSLEQKVSEFTKITATLKAQPDNRQQIRDKISQNAPTLLQALNQFITVAKKSLPDNRKDLILIVDNLDRIVEQQSAANEPSNYDEIFIKHHEQLRGLDCHLIYTVPITIVYSERCTELQNNFDETSVLPMVMLRHEDDRINEKGLKKFREMIVKRIEEVTLKDQPHIGQELAQALDSKVFVSSEVLDHLCLMSGGHVRLLMKMIQKAIDWTEDLPISKQAVNTAIEEAKNDYRNTIFEHQWPLLREVAATKQIPNNESDREYQRLLASRCILQYRYYDENDKLQLWYDVHPLVKDLEKFSS